MTAMITCPQCGVAIRYQYQLDNHVAQTHTRLFTADHVLITDGLAVWDYNLDLEVVDLSTARAEYNGDVWFSTKTPAGKQGPLMNGVRVTTRHPSTGQTAYSALFDGKKEVES